MDRSGGKAGSKHMTMASTAPKRIGTAKKSAPVKKAVAAKSVKKPAPAKAKKAVPAKKAAAPAAAKKPVVAKQPQAQPSKAAAAPKLETPVAASANGGAKPAPAAKPVAATPPRPAGSGQSLDERRKAATRKFFARLRSLEAIIGADLRKRGSVVLMQAVDQWYNEAINANATDVSITNAAKVVIAHL
jgi:hypothetical protein